MLVREGSRLSQIRFRRGHALLDAAALRALHDARAADRRRRGRRRRRHRGRRRSRRARARTASSAIAPSATPALIDVERRGGYDVADFWEPIAARADKSLILDPDEFYILASKEAVQVPPDYAAEMVPFDPLVGEFRVHYAGFFDPGFGYAGAGGRGARAVLEVRSREVPFILEHGQIVGRLVYEKMAGAAGQALRPGHRLELPGAGPEAVEALSGLILRGGCSAQPAELGELIRDIAAGARGS